MVKRYVVKYDELGKPIEIVEIKEFTDPAVLKSFKEKCEENKAALLEREKERESKKLEEKKEVLSYIENLHKEIADLKLVICHLFGFAEFDESTIKEILGVDENESQD